MHQYARLNMNWQQASMKTYYNCKCIEGQEININDTAMVYNIADLNTTKKNWIKSCN